MPAVRDRVKHVAAHIGRTVAAMSPLFYVALLGVAAVAILSSDFYLKEVLVLVIVFAHFTASWDVLCGYSAQDNFGHAFFIGAAGYVAALLNTSLDLSPWLTVPIAAGTAALLGVAVGWLTLRLRGPYFALSTIAFAAVLFKLAYILSTVTGGEEGISGIDPFSSTVDPRPSHLRGHLRGLHHPPSAFVRSHYGLILRSTQHNEDAAQALRHQHRLLQDRGLRRQRLLRRDRWAMYTHTKMQVNRSCWPGRSRC